MSYVNPYASPFSADCVPPLVTAQVVGEALYRQGKLLVMHKQAVLPDRCVKSNQPAHGRRLKRKLYLAQRRASRLPGGTASVAVPSVARRMVVGSFQ